MEGEEKSIDDSQDHSDSAVDSKLKAPEVQLNQRHNAVEVLLAVSRNSED